MTGPCPATDVGLFERVLGAIPTGVLVLDEVGHVIYANHGASLILGRSAEELLGNSCADIFKPLPEMLAERTSDPQMSARASSRGRPEVSLGYRLSPVEIGEQGQGYVVVFQNLEPIERLRVERDRLLRLAAVGETLPGVLHEIKNPLAGISTSVEVLLEETSNAHVKRELRAILGEVHRIKLSLEGIGLFRSEPWSRRACAVDRALREAYVVVEPQLVRKGIQGVLDVPDLPLLPLEGAVLRAFVFNLMSNAIHACDAGSTITLSARVRDSGGTLEISVTDTGSGMTPEVLARCRELFFTTKGNGCGIGLSLCADVVERAGGRFGVTSSPGRGTTVVLEIPIVPGPDRQRTPDA